MGHLGLDSGCCDGQGVRPSVASSGRAGDLPPEAGDDAAALLRIGTMSCRRLLACVLVGGCNTLRRPSHFHAVGLWDSLAAKSTWLEDLVLALSTLILVDLCHAVL